MSRCMVVAYITKILSRVTERRQLAARVASQCFMSSVFAAIYALLDEFDSIAPL